MIVSLLLLACSPTKLATVPEGTRLTQMANGELIVGTATGDLWFVDSFGGRRQEASGLGDSIADLVSDPLGRYWVRTDGGAVFTGGLWAEPTRVATDAALLVQDCESVGWLTADQLEPNVTAIGFSSCEKQVRGYQDGGVDGSIVTHAPLVRVQSVGTGVLWVDEAHESGCMGCRTRVPHTGTRDALYLYLPPFVPGEIAWLDQEGGLWIAPA